MTKLVSHGSWGFFSSTPATYDHKTVYDLNEAIELDNNGWDFDNSDFVFHNLALFLWRDLKNMEEIEPTVEKKRSKRKL